MTEINNINNNKFIDISEITKENINSNNLDIYNNFFDNQYQNDAFLTNIPINNNKENNSELKSLKKKENSLVNKINLVKNKRIDMDEISLINVPKAKIDNNTLNYNIKHANSLAKNLSDKLKEIKEQIKLLSNNNREKRNKKENQKMTYFDEQKNNFVPTSIKNQLLEQNKIRMKEVENNYIKKRNIIEDEEKKRENYLKEKKKEEMEIIKKRKSENDKKVVKLKKYIIKTPSKNDIFLYQKLNRNFIEKENKLINDANIDKKVKNLIYKPNFYLQRQRLGMINNNSESEKKLEEKKNEMKKLWHSRSMILKNFQNDRNKLLFLNEEKITSPESTKNKNTERMIYSKKVKLPTINEKLKEEAKFRAINIKQLTGKNRINFVNKKYSCDNFKILNKFKNLDYGKYFAQQTSKKNDIRNKSDCKSDINENIERNIKNFKFSKINAIPNNLIYDLNIKRRINPKEINYLKDLKETTKKKYHNWNNYILDNEETKFDVDGVQNILKKIEKLDEKVKLCKELIKINGKYENYTELENKVNDMKIDSMKGKLVVLKEICKGSNIQL